MGDRAEDPALTEDPSSVPGAASYDEAASLENAGSPEDCVALARRDILLTKLEVGHPSKRNSLDIGSVSWKK